MNVHPDKTAWRAVDACGGASIGPVRTDYERGWDDALKTACLAVKKPDALTAELLASLKELVPTNIYTGNPNVADAQVLPCDVTMGELRRAVAVIAKATGEA